MKGSAQDYFKLCNICFSSIISNSLRRALVLNYYDIPIFWAYFPQVDVILTLRLPAYIKRVNNYCYRNISNSTYMYHIRSYKLYCLRTGMQLGWNTEYTSFLLVRKKKAIYAIRELKCFNLFWIFRNVSTSYGKALCTPCSSVLEANVFRII